MRNGISQTAIFGDINTLTARNLDGEGESGVARGEVGVFAFGARRDCGVGAGGRGGFVEVEGVGVCVDGGEVDGGA
jgi:hypothetical protein